MVEVFFSNRAYVSLLKETQARIATETGGIFLGHVIDDKWYIVEALDPGPKAVFMTAYFEYDRKYLDHLLTKINYLYKKPLRIIGLWHRHPGNFNIFSTTDDGTNFEFAKLNKQGAISALVNIDPKFTLTTYHVSNVNRAVSYQKVKKVNVGDKYIPQEILQYADINEVLDDINNYRNRKSLREIEEEIRPKINIDKFISDFVVNAKVIEKPKDEFKNETFKLFADVDIEKVLEVIEKDMEFFNKNGLKYILKTNGALLKCIFGKEKNTEISFGFLEGEKPFFIFNDIIYEYEQGLFLREAEEKLVLEGNKEEGNCLQRTIRKIKYSFQKK